MFEQYQNLLIGVGLAVIAALVWLINRQLRAQRQAREAQQQVLDEMRVKAQQQRDYLIESIRVISSAVADGQCELTEGCIRLKKLLDHLAPHLHQHESFGVFNQIYDATQHMPILDAWKKLKIKQRFAYTQERETLEQRHREAILIAAKALSRYHFEQ
ncbi:MAG: MFS superfamily sulfate permease-like transporter [Motiliproteus sp.]|jgi:MFS superfamily sulfate permease-like transporter